MALGNNLNRKKDKLFPEKENKPPEPKKTTEKKPVKGIKSYLLSGNVTISDIQNRYNEIKKILEKEDKIHVKIRNIEKYDLSFLQLVKALRQDKNVRLSAIGFKNEELNKFGFKTIL